MIPIYGEESALVTDANAHFIGLCTIQRMIIRRGIN